VIETEIGDFVCLDGQRTKRNGDCPVILMSRETGEREWCGGADFLEELLTAEVD
jgi:hypothetical protein